MTQSLSKSNIKSVIERSDTLAGRRFDGVIQTLIILSVISFTLETMPGLAAWQKLLLTGFEVFCVLVFTLEYVSRIWVAEHKLKFIFSFYGLVDLLAILPFYLSFGVDLRTLRAFRLLRLFKILRLPKYARAIRRIRLALALIKEELILFLSLSGVLLYLSSVGIYYFEHAAQPEVFTSVLHSLWWSLITLTTVGYGDMYPITAGGKLFTFAVLLVGLGIISIPAGLIASALSEARDIAEDRAAVNQSSEDQPAENQGAKDQGADDQKGAEPSTVSVKPDQ